MMRQRRPRMLTVKLAAQRASAYAAGPRTLVQLCCDNAKRAARQQVIALQLRDCCGGGMLRTCKKGDANKSPG
eukprot:2551529-Prymnesium_polylepis.1